MLRILVRMTIAFILTTTIFDDDDYDVLEEGDDEERRSSCDRISGISCNKDKMEKATSTHTLARFFTTGHGLGHNAQQCSYAPNKKRRIYIFCVFQISSRSTSSNHHEATDVL